MKVDQLDTRWDTPQYRRFYKRLTSRLRRRLGKRDPENGPRRLKDVTRGYSS